MTVKLGDGARLIFEVINKYRKTNLSMYRLAMYKRLTGSQCLWFPQVSTKPVGSEDDFRPRLSAENWISQDGKTLYERAKTVSFDNALNANNHLKRITFANKIPTSGYQFIGVFEFVGRRTIGNRTYREYKRIADTTNTATW